MMGTGNHRLRSKAYRRLAGAVALALGLAAPTRASAQSSLVLGIQGNHFTVNGTAKFLVFASYFDALDVSDADIEADLTYLQQHGIDGIRIFPDWRTQISRTDPSPTCAGDTVMDPGGDLREGPFNNMIYLLNKAREHGMLVDISLSSELVSSVVGASAAPPPDTCSSTLTLQELTTGVRRLTQRLTGDGYRHVMFDLQNEVDNFPTICLQGRIPIAMSDIQTLIDTHVHAIDPDRIVFASITQAGDARTDGGASLVKQAATSQHAMVIAYHEPRQGDWVAATATVVDKLFTDGRPIYLQEPAKVQDVAGWDGLTAVGYAKQHGAAAWTFHTNAGFYMNDHGIAWHLQTDAADAAYGTERSFLNGLVNKLANTAWGANPAGQPVTPVPPLTQPGYPSLMDFTGDRRADLGEWHRPSGQFWVRMTTGNAIQPIGQWWSHASTVTPTPGWEVLVADFNGDGFADYMDRHIASGKVWIHLGDGLGGFSPNVWVTGQTRSGVDVEVFPGDVNGDRRADLIEHNRATGELQVRLNTGVADPVLNADIINPNNFLLSTDPAAFHTAAGGDWRTIVGDFTGDGLVDIVDYHVPSAHFWVHANIGANQWNGNVVYDAGAFSFPGFTTLFGDFTGDGWTDYADVNTATGELWVHANLRNGTFDGANWLYAVISHSSGFCVMGLPVCW
jgi:hypothetical protein